MQNKILPPVTARINAKPSVWMDVASARNNYVWINDLLPYLSCISCISTKCVYYFPNIISARELFSSFFIHTR